MKKVNARVLFITTGLHTGGAEKQLARLLSRLHGRVIEAEVVSLATRGPVSAEIEALGVPVWHLGIVNPLRVLQAAWRLARIVRQFRPEVIHGWMYHGNLAAWLARKAAGPRTRLAWGIRQSLYDLAREKPATRRVIRLGARFSAGVDAVVYNSETARAQHEAIGYARARAQVIDNGFDTGRFCPDGAARGDVRRELGLPATARLIGLIARYHPMKGHEVFLEAARRLAAKRNDVHFLLAGREVTAEHPVFKPWTRQPSLDGRLHLLGERTDIPRLAAALDIASSSSTWGEAFPNAIAEAMSCGVPCVATNVGDVRRIVGETGIVVPAGDAAALADGWDRILALPEADRQALGVKARERVAAHFSLESVAARYAALYEEMRT